jgi:hypothetical protein
MMFSASVANARENEPFFDRNNLAIGTVIRSL